MTETRADWERHKNYPPRWSWATWPERAVVLAVWITSAGVGAVMAFGIVLVLGETVDGIARHNAEHARCLKQAANGYEIRQCR
jgi:hypothetical protein